MHTGIGTVKRAVQTIKNMFMANMDHGNSLTKSVNRALKVKRFTIHMGLKRTAFELHHDMKPRKKLSNKIKVGKSYS